MTNAQTYATKSKTSLPASWLTSLLFNMLEKLVHGQIVIEEGNNTRTFGSDSSLQAHVTINDNRAYRKILFGGSIGAGEAYIDKLWDVDNLTALVRIMVLNMSLLDRMERGLAWLTRPVDLAKHLLNSNNKHGSRRNILAHYDLGNDMYRSFLDPTMMYSSAIYPDCESTLEEAQQNKLDIICKKLDLKPTDTVVEIGSGWGGFAIHAATHYGCHVTTTTISDAQYAEASKRIEALGLTDKITLVQKDYRELTGRFDKLVSIEMIEAVGHKYLPDFFKQCESLLKPDGQMLIQAITIADQKYAQYARSVDFIQRYIFPGGCVPSNARMLGVIAEKTDMVVRQIDDFGFDYARTINDWRKRFSNSYEQLLQKGYDETFKRLWEFYLCYCEGGFLERSISVVHVVATRPGNRRTIER
ncbi:class I SAM-dependent methyltransferase [Desulforhopalus sp. 52FAK]